MENLTKRTIIVTGCNKGIGYGIVEQLCKKEQIPQIIMACRNEKRAISACESLLKKYPNAKGKLKITILDVSDFKSCDNFVSFIKKEYGQVDCIVNNAAVLIEVDVNTEELARKVLQVNYFGTAYLTLKMIPFIKENGKIITMGSQGGNVRKVSTKLQNRLLNPKATKHVIDEIGEEFCVAMRDQKIKERGFFNSMYCISKILLNVWVCKVLSKKEEIMKKGIQVYCLCPGWVNTDMGRTNGKTPPRTIEQGAETPVYLIDLPYKMDKRYQGQFFYDNKVINFVSKK